MSPLSTHSPQLHALLLRALLRRWWQSAEKPWEALAACMEVRDALATGDPATFVSRLPVQIDGSCNGLQHYAALGRDLDGGFSVNLLPSDRPQVRCSAPAPKFYDMQFRRDGSCSGLQCCADLGQHLDETCSHHIEAWSACMLLNNPSAV